MKLSESQHILYILILFDRVKTQDVGKQY